MARFWFSFLLALPRCLVSSGRGGLWLGCVASSLLLCFWVLQHPLSGLRLVFQLGRFIHLPPWRLPPTAAAGILVPTVFGAAVVTFTSVEAYASLHQFSPHSQFSLPLQRVSHCGRVFSVAISSAWLCSRLSGGFLSCTCSRVKMCTVCFTQLPAFVFAIQCGRMDPVVVSGWCQWLNVRRRQWFPAVLW